MEIKAKIQLLLLKRRVFHTFSLSISNIYNGRSFRPKHTTPLPYSAAPITAIITQLPEKLQIPAHITKHLKQEKQNQQPGADEEIPL